MRRQRDRFQEVRTTATETPDKPAFDGFATSAGAVPANAGKANAPASMPGKAATRTATREAMRNAAFVGGPQMTEYGQAMRDEISDAEAARYAGLDTEGEIEERTPENLPAVVSKALATSGERVYPKWHMVRHLPGYMREAIRAGGRAVFRQFTDTPLEDIQMITTILNPEREIQALANWIKHNGVCDDDPELDFDQVFPGYKVRPQLWNVEGYSFLLVQDHAGKYIYGWPGGRGVHLDNDAPRPMLR